MVVFIDTLFHIVFISCESLAVGCAVLIGRGSTSASWNHKRWWERKQLPNTFWEICLVALSLHIWGLLLYYILL